MGEEMAKDYLETKNQFKIINSSMLELDKHIKPNNIDSIVTDPPYELNFMNKGWDNAGVSFNKDTWKKCYEVLKPGGYLLAFGGSRTFHRIACAIEDAGFEIRDTIMWLYGSGFPKSMNLGLAIDKKNGVESKVVGEGKSGVSSRAYQSEETTTAGKYEIKQATNEWQGWGTCLKPAFEPIIVARKPFKGSLVDNVLEYGVGGLNIDECRVELQENETIAKNVEYKDIKQSDGWGTKKCITEQSNQGRFPANLILTYDETDFDEVCGGFPNSNKPNGSITNPNLHNSLGDNGIFNKYSDKQPLWNAYQDSGSASRYFYCAKASKKDRDEGLDEFKNTTVNDGRNTPIDNAFQRGETPRKNIHPTVKPTTLMQYLIRLVTPKGGTVLDPFMGSGSTGKAVAYENNERDANYSFIGIELIKEYCDIAQARITSTWVSNWLDNLLEVEENEN